MFREAVKKFNRHGFMQPRTLVVTTMNIYIFKGDDLSVRQQITDLRAIIKSTKTSEIVFVFPKSRDLRLQGMSAEQIKQAVSMI